MVPALGCGESLFLLPHLLRVDGVVVVPGVLSQQPQVAVRQVAFVRLERKRRKEGRKEGRKESESSINSRTD